MIHLTSDMYSEVYAYINSLGEEYIKKIPKEEYKVVSSKRNKNYNPKYEIEEFMYENTISYEAKCFILYFYLRYWC